MSVAFEYGGLDREPVVWTERRRIERQVPDDFDEERNTLGEHPDMSETSMIHLMIISQ